MKRVICLMFSIGLCGFCWGAVVTQSYLSPDGVTVEKLDSNRLVLTNAANSVDGGLLQSESVTADKLDANATPVNRWDESFNDFVFEGLIVPTSADFDSTTTSGIAYINGFRVVKDATPHTYSSSVLTYLDLSENGTYTYSETAGGGAVPSVALKSIRLMIVSTDLTTVSFVSDERTTIVTLGTGSVTSITDIDEDTMVQVEKTSDDDIIRFDTEGTEQVIIQDGEVLPTTDDDINLGSATKQFKDLHIDGTANIDTLAVDDIGTVSTGTWQGTDIALGYGGIGSNKIDSGFDAVNATSNGTISFNFTFGSAPNVVVTPRQDNDTAIGLWKIKTISTTNFVLRNFHTGALTFEWIAFGAE